MISCDCLNNTVQQTIVIVEYPHPQDCHCNQGRNNRYIIQGTQNFDSSDFAVHSCCNDQCQNHSDGNTNHVDYSIQKNFPKLLISEKLNVVFESYKVIHHVVHTIPLGQTCHKGKHNRKCHEKTETDKWRGDKSQTPAMLFKSCSIHLFLCMFYFCFTHLFYLQNRRKRSVASVQERFPFAAYSTLSQASSRDSCIFGLTCSIYSSTVIEPFFTLSNPSRKISCHSAFGV